MKNNRPCLVTTTTNNEGVAETIAQELITTQLAACVQIHPVTSYFIWEGDLNKTNEFRLDIKTFNKYYTAVERLIINNHNYGSPEITQTEIIGGSHDYLSWMNTACLDLATT